MTAVAPWSETPLCECHQEAMFWHRDSRRKSGGYWQCRVKRDESDQRYVNTDKGYTTVMRKRRNERLKRLDEQKARVSDQMALLDGEIAALLAKLFPESGREILAFWRDPASSRQVPVPVLATISINGTQVATGQPSRRARESHSQTQEPPTHRTTGITRAGSRSTSSRRSPHDRAKGGE